MNKKRNDYLERQFAKHHADRRYADECINFIQHADDDFDMILRNYGHTELLSDKLKKRVIDSITKIKVEMEKYDKPEVKT